MFDNREIGSSGLIFPIYRKNNDDIMNKMTRIRCSEQEARYVFMTKLCELRNQQKYGHLSFSLETPTRERYGDFNKADQLPKIYKDNDEPGGTSGSIDLSIYGSDKENPGLNIEFKAKNPDIKSFQKDLLKLFSEEADGVWIHQIDEKEGDCEKIDKKLRDARDSLMNSYKDKTNKRIVVYIINLLTKNNLVRTYHLPKLQEDVEPF